MQTNAMAVMEALVRLKDPQLGISNPLDFIPLAEESFQIGLITAFVIEAASQQISGWNTKYEQDYFVGINISPLFP